MSRACCTAGVTRRLRMLLGVGCLAVLAVAGCEGTGRTRRRAGAGPAAQPHRPERHSQPLPRHLQGGHPQRIDRGREGARPESGRHDRVHVHDGRSGVQRRAAALGAIGRARPARPARPSPGRTRRRYEASQPPDPSTPPTPSLDRIDQRRLPLNIDHVEPDQRRLDDDRALVVEPHGPGRRAIRPSDRGLSHSLFGAAQGHQQLPLHAERRVESPVGRAQSQQRRRPASCAPPSKAPITTMRVGWSTRTSRTTTKPGGTGRPPRRVRACRWRPSASRGCRWAPAPCGSEKTCGASRSPCTHPGQREHTTGQVERVLPPEAGALDLPL